MRLVTTGGAALWDAPVASTFRVPASHPNFKAIWDGTATGSGCTVTAAYVALTCPGSPEQCSGHGTCDTTTGLCTCAGGFAGTDCSVNTATTTLGIVTPTSPVSGQVRRHTRVRLPVL